MARTRTTPGSNSVTSASPISVKSSSGSQSRFAGRKKPPFPGNNKATKVTSLTITRKTRVRNVKAESTAERVHAGFAFVVLCGTDIKKAEWKYVHLSYGTTLDTCDAPFKVFPTITREMGEMWKRVVIDDAYDWENYNYVHPKTLKLVEVYHHTQDVTNRLFYNDEEMNNQSKLAALSKLDANDAKVLGVDRDYFMLKMFQNSGYHRADEDRATAMRDAQVELEVKPRPMVPLG